LGAERNHSLKQKKKHLRRRKKRKKKKTDDEDVKKRCGCADKRRQGGNVKW
jgi:hypothetical protein